MAGAKGSLGELALGVSRSRSVRRKRVSGHDDCPDIVEFVEAPWGLGRKMFSAQRVILKAYYGIPLDTKVRDVHITDWKRQNEQVFTEAEYLAWLYEQGRSNIREVHAGDRRRDLVLAIGRRSGKCILGSSLVLTSRGVFKIEDLLPDPALLEDCSTPLCVQVAQEGGVRADTSHFYNGGVKTVREFTTHCGYRLGGTDNHRIKVLYESGEVQWKYLADLQVGDIVAVHRGTNLWAEELVDCRPYHTATEIPLPERLDERWGFLLGCLVGGGHRAKRDSVSMTFGDPETWSSVRELFSGLLGSGSGEKDTGDLQFRTAKVREFLHNLGWRWDSPQDAKEIPWSLLRSPRPVVAAFLRGLFEMHGGVEGKTPLPSEAKRLVEKDQRFLLGFGIISTLSPSRCLAEQVQTLLLNFGIVSVVFPRVWNGSACWGLRIRGAQSWKTFAEEIGFLTERKKKALLYFTPKVDPALPCQSPEADYFFDAVLRIEEKQEQVWDLTVPEGHSFVANGVVNHNTEMAAWITSYEIFKLLRRPNPQGYYGIPEGDEIKLCAVATGRDQAGELYAKAKHYFLDCTLFDPYRANMTTTYSRFQTQQDIQKYGRYGSQDVTQATIKATFYSCIAKGLRGAGNIVVVLDEIAHFVSSGQSSGKEVYKAVTPSIAAFSAKNPNDPTESLGPTEGRVVLISSPLGAMGFFYKKFRQGFDRPGAMLCIQAPTWEVNPSISAEDLETFYTDDPTDFFTEFGAEFSDRTRGWIERREDLVQCIDPRLSRLLKAPARRPHFLGLDVGVTKGGDGTAVAIGHIDSQQRVVLDYVEWLRAGEGQFQDKRRLDFEEIADWLVGLGRRFHITEGIMDRWAGLPMEQYLQKKGMRQVVSKLFTPKETTFMYKTFKDMMWDQRLVLYNWQPTTNGSGILLREEDGDLCDYLAELLSLQEEKISRHVSKIEAPQTGDQHDDCSDALIRMVWLASQKLGNPRYISGGRNGASGLVSDRGYGNTPRLSALRRARLGGSHPSRQVAGRLSRRNTGNDFGARGKY